jgi:ABC-type antimicrobial peptide transport system permease subunit
MGSGAVVDYRLIPPALRNAQQSTVTGPNAYFIRTRDGDDSPAALRSLQKISHTINATNDDQPSGGAVSVLRPAEILDSGSIELIPTVLGAALALGAVVALMLTLLASVRRRRRDLALLKTLGLSGRQLAMVVAWQSSVAVAIGAIVGVPLGIVAGRVLWDLFAGEIHAVPAPSVPGLSIVVVVAAALILANVVAAIPGRIAARTPTALMLRAE